MILPASAQAVACLAGISASARYAAEPSSLPRKMTLCRATICRVFPSFRRGQRSWLAIYSAAATPRRGTRILRVRPILLAAAFAACLGAADAAAQGRAALPDSFADITEKLASAVVNISTTQGAPAERAGADTPQAPPGSPFEEFFKDFFGERGGRGGQTGPRPKMQSLGSGFIIDPAGFIVTNNHVVADAEEITVTLSDETVLKATLVGRDSVTDLALLKIDAKQKLPAVNWGDSSKTRVGDWVLAIGNPFGLGGSVTAGIVSARARDIHAGPYDDFLQTDAPINRGNSGGPMFNLGGEVVGIATAIYSPSGGSIGIGFAIPSSLARPVIDQLKANGKVDRGWIGVRIQPVTDELAEGLGLDKARGALVTEVDANGPAAKAKLLPGDVILSFDGKPVERTRALPRMVADTPADKTVKMTVWRDGKETATDIKVALLNPEQITAAAARAAPERQAPPTVDTLGLSLAKVTPELRQDLDLPPSAKGVVIVDLEEDSAAAKRGMRPGDLIVAVGREPVNAPEQVVEKIEAAKKAGRKVILLRIEREGTSEFVALPLS
jgi:serine protease Do